MGREEGCGGEEGHGWLFSVGWLDGCSVGQAGELGVRATKVGAWRGLLGMRLWDFNWWSCS